MRYKKILDLINHFNELDRSYKTMSTVERKQYDDEQEVHKMMIDVKYREKVENMASRISLRHWKVRCNEELTRSI
ncbi:hypothetical protein [Gracilibacillus suaedae]|uniref:hypothetical protein n=1 Tax=Gracilibacillus suaedae TaxID=2820273 RepID=UPI001ABE34DF|nr:hypothetical protein [Gracilibacillus suaedae]